MSLSVVQLTPYSIGMFMGIFDRFKTKSNNMVEERDEEDLYRNSVFDNEQLDLYEKIAANFNSMTSENVNKWNDYCEKGNKIIDNIDRNQFNKIFIKKGKKGYKYMHTDFGVFHTDIKLVSFFDLLKSIYAIRSGEHEYDLSLSSYGNYILLSEQYSYLFNSVDKTLNEQLILYHKMSEILSHVNASMFPVYILVKAKESNFPSGYNTEFGYYYDVNYAFSTIRNEISYGVKNIPTFIDNLQFFNDKLLSIPRHEININYGNKVSRKSLIDIKNIPISRVGRQFDKSKLIKYVVIDIETTGLYADKDSIIELSAIRCVDYQPVDCFSILINPSNKITSKITSINGITNDMVKNSPHIDEVIEDFDKYIAGFDVVGYNIVFDLKFLFVSGSKVLDQKRIKFYDTYELAKKSFSLDKYSLEEVCKMELKLYRDNAHRSLSDCLATNEVFIKCIETITKPDIV